MDIFIEGGEQNLYLKSAFGYHSISRAKSVYSEINLCFHDFPVGIQYYFFSGTQAFLSNWNNFIGYIDSNSEGRKNFNFSIIPIKSLENGVSDEDYKFEYETEVFDSYDGNPIKSYNINILKTCDVIMGEFFMSK